MGAIAESGRILARSALQGAGAPEFRSLADPSIQDRRAQTRVPCGCGGVLSDYVPFSFSPRSPMLYRVAKGGVPGHPEGGQDRLVFFVVDVAVLGHRRPDDLVITDGHPLKKLTRFEPWSTSIAHDLLDPEVLSDAYWTNTDDDGDRERRRQAELLVHDHLNLEDVLEVTCRTVGTAREVRNALLAHSRSIQVRVAPGYYDPH